MSLVSFVAGAYSFRSSCDHCSCEPKHRSHGSYHSMGRFQTICQRYATRGEHDTDGGCLFPETYPLSLAAMTQCFQTRLLFFSHFAQPCNNLSADCHSSSACLPGCIEVPSCRQRCPVWSLHYLQDSSQEPCQPRLGWLLCAAGSACIDSNIAALH